MRLSLTYCFITVVQTTSLAQSPALVVPLGHSAAVQQTNFSHDGRFVVTASVDQSAKIWDSRTGKLIRTLKGHTQYLNKAIFSHNDKMIATAGRDAICKIWDAVSGELIHTLARHDYSITDVAFSEDDKKIVTSSEDQKAIVWDLKTAEPLIVLKEHDDKIIKLAYSKNNSFIATASEDNTAIIWNAITGSKIFHLQQHKQIITDMVLSGDDQRLATASNDGSVVLWSTNNGKPIQTFQRIKANPDTWPEPATSLALNPNGKEITVGYRDGAIIQWDVTSGNIVRQINWCKQKITAIQYHVNGKYFLFASEDGMAYFDNNNPTPLFQIKHNSAVTDVHFDPNFQKIVTASFDESALISNANTGQEIARLKSKINVGYYGLAAFSPKAETIMLPSKNGSIDAWNICLAQKTSSKQLSSKSVSAVKYSSNGKYYAVSTMKYNVADKDSSIHLFESSTHQMIFKDLGQYYFNTAFSFANKRALLAYGNKKEIKIQDIENKVEKTITYKHTDQINWMAFSENDDSLIVGHMNQTIYVIALATNTSIREMTNVVIPEESQLVFENKRFLKTNFKNKYDSVYICNWSNGDTLFTLNGHRKKISKAVFNKQANKLVTVCEDSTVRLWNVLDGRLVQEWKNIYSDDNQVTVAFIQNETALMIASDSTLRIWDLEEQKLLLKKTTKSIFGKISFSADQQYMLIASYDGLLQLWSLNTLKKLYDIINFESTDYLALTTEGFYKATINANKQLHYVTNEANIISFEQLDLIYNRPDKVLEAAGCADEQLISSIEKAYQKRIRKYGLTNAAVSLDAKLPTADFKNRSFINYDQKKQVLRLSIQANGFEDGLKTLNVWVNEVPVYGMKGISIQPKPNQRFDTIIKINLSEGINQIETSVTNQKGLESYKMPLTVQYLPRKKQSSKLYFVGIGIDQFLNPTHNLQYSVKDIRDLAANLKKKYGKNIVIDTLLNRSVTVENVKALKKKLTKTNVNDRVIISYSGHGLLNKDLDYFLSTYAVDFNDPENEGLAYEELEDLTDGIAARKKLMLIDACHSGEVDKETQVAISTMNTGDSSIIAGAKGVTPLIAVAGKKMGMKNSFQLMQELFVKVGKRTGATVISAAAGTQFALERGDLKNGVFTYSILEYLQNNTSATVADLKKYVNLRVPELTKGLQVPTTRSETNAAEWKIW